MLFKMGICELNAQMHKPSNIIIHVAINYKSVIT